MRCCFCRCLCRTIGLIALISAFSEVPNGSLSGILALCVVRSRWIGLGKIFTRLGGGGGGFPGRFSALRRARIVARAVVQVIGMFKWMFKKV